MIDILKLYYPQCCKILTTEEVVVPLYFILLTSVFCFVSLPIQNRAESPQSFCPKKWMVNAEDFAVYHGKFSMVMDE